MQLIDAMKYNILNRAGVLGAFVLLLPVMLVLNGCDDLVDPRTYDVVSPQDFYRTEAEFLAALVPVYAALDPIAEGQYYWASQVSTDESIVPTRGQDWDDGGVFRRLKSHTWTATDPASSGPWNDAYTGIARANTVLENLEGSTVPGADEFRAELRTMRAFYYYILMDHFGGVPIVTVAVTDPDNPPTRASRRETFDFIEQELLESIPNLPKERSGGNEGRVTEWVARAILASMYMNSEVWAGEPMYEKAIEQADLIINSGYFQLAEDFFQNFAIDNHTSPEIIFALQQVAQGGPGFGFGFKTLHYNQWPQGCCNGLASLPGNYDRFEEDDLRRNMFLTGQAYNFYTGEPAMDRQGNPLIFTKEVPLTGAGEHHGYRPLKWPVDPNDPSGDQQNDYAFFRLAEMYLIKAESLWRLGREAEALPLINAVRERAFDPPRPLTMADIQAQGGMGQFLLDERSRELNHEGKRRQDLIRFGQFTAGTWEFKEPSEEFRNLFPIPQSQLDANPNLTQNPGY